jgi:hypothetical protein
LPLADIGIPAAAADDDARPGFADAQAASFASRAAMTLNERRPRGYRLGSAR